MGEGQPWLLVKSAFLLIDIGGYGFKEWVALIASLIGIAVSVVGAWKTWRYSKSQIVNRLFEFLNEDEKHVIAGRQRVLGYLRACLGSS